MRRLGRGRRSGGGRLDEWEGILTLHLGMTWLDEWEEILDLCILG